MGKFSLERIEIRAEISVNLLHHDDHSYIFRRFNLFDMNKITIQNGHKVLHTICG
jgi:hypothetical protein